MKHKTEKELKEREITQDILSKFDSVRASFIRFKLDVDDYEKFAKMIDAAKSLKYHIADIQNHLTKESSHNERVLKLEKQIQSQEKQINKNNIESNSLNKKINDLKNQLTDLSINYKKEKKCYFISQKTRKVWNI